MLQKRGTATPQAVAVLCIASIFIAIATLSPGAAAVTDARATLWCWACGANGGSDFTLNIALFIPFGIALALLHRTPARIVVVGALLSVSIEALQYFGFPPGRVSNVTDVVANTAGALIGGLLGVHGRTLIFPRAKQSRRLTAFGIVIVTILCIFCGWALAPNSALTDNPRSVLNTTLPFPSKYGWFHAVVRAAAINDVRGSRDEGGPVNIEVPHSDSLSGVATVVGRDERTELIAFLYANERDQLPRLLLGQRAADAQLRGAVNATRLRMSVPTLTVRSVFTSTSTAGNKFEFVVTPRFWELRAINEERSQTATLPISLGLGWVIFQSVLRVGDTGWKMMSNVWLLMIWLPVGYWSTLASKQGTLPAQRHPYDASRIQNFRRWNFVAAGVGSMALVMWLVPLASGISATLAHEWGFSFLGLATGAFFANWSSRYILSQ